MSPFETREGNVSHRWKKLMAILFVVSLVAGACGDDDDDAASKDDEVTTDDDAPSEASRKPIALSIKALETTGPNYAFQGLAGAVANGRLDITLDNSGAKEEHEFQIVKLGDGKKLDEFLATFGEEGSPTPEWLDAAGGPAAAPPGGSSKASVDLSAGDYGYFCTYGDGDNQHYKKGMKGEFKVNADGEGDLPKADTTITAKSYEFEVDGLKVGNNTVEFKVEGKELHHVQLFPIVAGKTIEDVKASFNLPEDQQTGPPPVDFEKGSGTSVIGSDFSEVTELKVAGAGKYVMLCFISDRAGGPPHFTKGMIQEVTVS